MTTPPDLEQIAHQINAAAAGTRMDAFQDLRALLNGRRRATSRIFVPANKTFAKETDGGSWGFHYGGRTELQYNIGIEPRDGAFWFRHGVAFSVEPSQSYPDLHATLEPLIVRYNEYMREFGDRYHDMRLWFFGSHPSDDIADKTITDNILSQGHFFFLGKRCRVDSIDIPAVIADFERLLDLYVYVQGKSPLAVTPESVTDKFTLTPRIPSQPKKTSATWARRHIDIKQRHRELECLLFKILEKRHGQGSVFAEQTAGSGAIDVTVDAKDGRWLYEVKTSTCIRSCLREGLAQLLEYAHWADGVKATKLVVVGEPSTDPSARKYLKTLRKRYGLPVHYARLNYHKSSLGPEE